MITRTALKGRSRQATRLIWHRERLAALLGFAIGLMIALLIVMAFDALTAITTPACTYHAPMLPIEGCKFVMKGNG